MNTVSIYVCLAVFFVNVYASSQKDIDGIIAVVTGGAKGIGRSIVEHFVKNGAKTVIFVDKNLPTGLKTERELNHIYGVNRTVFMHGDITIDLDMVSKKIFNTYGCGNVLVNNAGILDEYNPELMIKTNVLGTTLWTQRFFDCMRKDRGGRGGTIINVASIFAYTRDPFAYFYKASKFAVLGLSVGLGHEFNHIASGVRIFAICPGITYTDMTKQQMVVDEQLEIFNKLRKVLEWQTADDVGRGVALLYKTGTTGMAYTIEGGAAPIVSPDSYNLTVDYLLSL